MMLKPVMIQARINNTEHVHTMQERNIQIQASSFVHLVCTIPTNSMEPRSSLGPPLTKKLTTLYVSYHHQVYKTPPPVSIRSHINPVHVCTVIIIIILHTCFEKKMLHVNHTPSIHVSILYQHSQNGNNTHSWTMMYI
jgi:hypothetical protein